MWQPSPTTVVIRDVRLGFATGRYDVLLRAGVVAAVRTATPIGDRPGVIDGGQGTLLPGFVDHHLHLGAWLRARRSAPLLAEGVAATLAATPADRRGWRVVFGMDHQHDPAEAIEAVDAIAEPCLVMHRTGHACLLNSAAARLLGVGRSTMVDHGRGRWARALGPVDPEWEKEQLRWLARDLLGQGVIAVQDATPYPETAAARCHWLRRHLAPVRVDFMADPRDPLLLARWTKLFSVESAAGPPGRPLAVHAVEPTEIMDALALFTTRTTAGEVPHRIEHAALCPPALVERVARVDCHVCANPGFLTERAAALAPLTRTGEDAFLHPVAELVDAGVPVRFGSDAPVTRPGVWSALDAACRRGGPDVPFAGRSIPLADALAAVVVYAVPPRPDRWIGQPADLTVLAERHGTGPGAPSPVLATFVAGRLVHGG